MLERLNNYSGGMLSKERDRLKKMSRRDLLNLLKVSAASFPVASAASYLSTDILNIEEDVPFVPTKYGNFHMLYEVHGIGITTDNLPKKKKIDLFWREGVPENIVNFKDVDALELAGAVGIGEEMVEYCIKNKIKIGLGDLRVPIIMESDHLELVEAVIAGSLLFLALAGERETKDSQNLHNPKKVSRRTSIIATIGGLMILPEVLSLGLSTIAEYTQWPERDKLILRRVYGFLSNLHPENTHVFFRNAVWANKLLTLASEIREKKGGGDTEIVCNVGGGHSGLQDFLKIGNGLCRRIITSYPDWFLKKTIDLNGGIEGLISTFVVDLRKDQFGSQEELVISMVADKVLERQIRAKIGENYI